MVNAEEGASGPRCSAERPGSKSESRGSKVGPGAAMTAAELLKSAGASEVVTGGVEATEWEGRGPDGTIVRRHGYGQLTLGASWADMDHEEGYHATCEQMADDITVVVGTTSS